MSQLRMHVGAAARLHGGELAGRRALVPWLVTLTYARVDAWQAEHVKRAVDRMREWCKAEGHEARYVWVAEPQDGSRREDGVGRNAIHYHLVFWLPTVVRCPHFDRRGWWPHGMTQSKRARCAVAYLMSYLKKGKPLVALPKGARAYGVGGLTKQSRRFRWWLRLPRFVRGRASVDCRWQRAKGGGWCCPEGELWPSEFRREWVAGAWLLRRVHRHEVLIDAAGPFSWVSHEARLAS